jgi:CRP-like cAMP-binding protein
MLFSDIEIYIDYLRSSKLFSGLEDEEIEEFLKNSDYEIRKLNINEVLNPKFRTVIVLSGAVATFESNESGNKTMINLYYPSSDALIAVSHRIAYPSLIIQAKKSSLVLLLNFDSFTTLKTLNTTMLIVQNKVQQNIIKMLYEVSENLLDRAVVNNKTNARDKIMKFLEQSCKHSGTRSVNIPYTRNELADHLQIDTSTLMKELRMLQNDGIIEYNRKNISLLKKSSFNK